MCCLQWVRLRGQGARMLVMIGKSYKLRWSGKLDGVGGVGLMVMEELCEKVVEGRRVNDGVMTVFEQDVLRLICVYDSQNGRSLMN